MLIAFLDITLLLYQSITLCFNCASAFFLKHWWQLYKHFLFLEWLYAQYLEATSPMKCGRLSFLPQLDLGDYIYYPFVLILFCFVLSHTHTVYINKSANSLHCRIWIRIWKLGIMFSLCLAALRVGVYGGNWVMNSVCETSSKGSFNLAPAQLERVVWAG